MKSVAKLVVACAAVTTAVAQPAKQGQPMAAQGTLLSVAVCIGSHGAKSEGMGVFPRLAGTGQAYLLAQLDAFANGDRNNPVMLPISQSLKPAERQGQSQRRAKSTTTPMTHCTARPSTGMGLGALEMVAFSCLANKRN